LERPGLQRLFAENEASRIGMVVVYKIDRLTRSLGDFARLVERLDAAGCSFVSVTQLFNTATPMGRLTFKVLLSLAQFEREVIRDIGAVQSRAEEIVQQLCVEEAGPLRALLVAGTMADRTLSVSLYPNPLSDRLGIPPDSLAPQFCPGHCRSA
jgi:hypothetical protein